MSSPIWRGDSVCEKEKPSFRGRTCSGVLSTGGTCRTIGARGTRGGILCGEAGGRSGAGAFECIAFTVKSEQKKYDSRRNTTDIIDQKDHTHSVYPDRV